MVGVVDIITSVSNDEAADLIRAQSDPLQYVDHFTLEVFERISMDLIKGGGHHLLQTVD